MTQTFFPPNNKIKTKRKGRVATQILEREPIPFEEFTDEQLYAAKGGVLAFDIESYFNYFLVAFRCFNTNRVVYFDSNCNIEFDKPKLLWIVHNFCLTGFNSKSFDEPLLWLSMQPEMTTETLKYATNHLIKDNMRPSDIEKMYGFKMGRINHIDLIEVAPGAGSLKAYIARLHADRLQDLPFESESTLTQDQCLKVKDYCINTDLVGTLLLLNKLSPQLELRASLNEEFNKGLPDNKKIDLRSKSDAQIAETVICSEIQKKTGHYPKRPTIETGTIYKYIVPDHIRFQDPKLNEMLFEVANAPFEIGLSKKEGQIVVSPKELKNRITTIGSTDYRLGIGGIHSCEESVAHFADENTILVDVDVESYYPRLILNQNLYPEHIGPCVLEIFDNIVESRIADKHNAKRLSKLSDEEKTENFEEELKQAITGANSKKIIINSYYGKSNDNWSRLRAPGNMIQVTLTGQLSLLMLIEMAELHGIPAVSANTDGIVFKCNVDKYELLKDLVSKWEVITNFKTEETRYTAIYSANVNNYLAVKTDGKIKAKGWYADEGISKNPTNTICIESVVNLITDGTPIEQTILNCKDITKFVTCRNVKGGAEYDGYYLGKLVRFYMSKSQGTINYITSGNKVPESDGAKPLMDMKGLPSDINYSWYIEKANKILYKIGYYKTEKQVTFF